MAERKDLDELHLKLSAALDGELAAGERAQLEQRVADDPQAAALAEAMQEADRELRHSFGAVLDAPLPLDLVRSISTGGSEPWEGAGRAQYRPGARYLAQARRSSGFGRGLARAAAIVMLLGVGVAAGYLGQALFPSSQTAQSTPANAPPGWIEQVAQYHAFYAGETRHLVEVPASESEHIEAWIGDRVGHAFAIPDLSGEALAFQGARLLLVNGAPIAQLLYLPTEGRAVGICFKTTDKPDSAPVRADFDGTVVLSWNRNGVAYVIAGFEGEVALEPLVPLAESSI